MKKLIFSIISALMIMTMLVACGDDSTIKSATDASQGSTAAVQTTATEATTKSGSEGEEGFDGGFIPDSEKGADDGQDAGGVE